MTNSYWTGNLLAQWSQAGITRGDSVTEEKLDSHSRVSSRLAHNARTMITVSGEITVDEVAACVAEFSGITAARYRI